MNIPRLPLSPAAYRQLVTSYLLAMGGMRFPIKPIMLGAPRRPD